MKAGLTVGDHQALGHRLRAVKAEVLGMRTTIKATIGSATVAYQAATRSLAALQALENALLHEAVGEHADQRPMAELRQLYGSHGQEGT